MWCDSELHLSCKALEAFGAGGFEIATWGISLLRSLVFVGRDAALSLAKLSWSLHLQNHLKASLGSGLK
jgi:hypothetical protein